MYDHPGRAALAEAEQSRPHATVAKQQLSTETKLRPFGKEIVSHQYECVHVRCNKKITMQRQEVCTLLHDRDHGQRDPTLGKRKKRSKRSNHREKKEEKQEILNEIKTSFLNTFVSHLASTGLLLFAATVTGVMPNRSSASLFAP